MAQKILQPDKSYFDVFDQMSEAVYFCDTAGGLVYLNRVAAKTYGIVLGEVKGMAVTELFQVEEKNSALLQALYAKAPVAKQQVTYTVGGREYVRSSYAAPLFCHGELTGAYAVERDVTEMQHIVEENLSLQWKVQHHNEAKGADFSDDGLIGKSEIFSQCRKTAFQAGQQTSPVMLVGATGSGKEMFARAIHGHSDRRDRPFLALNCAAIPETLLEGILFGTAKGVYTGAIEREGLFAQANGGTIFLDEINSMALSSQAKLLRVLEEKKVYKLGAAKGRDIDVRIISSSNEQPALAVERGALREDLFYRLSVIYLQIPSLAMRREDIPVLVTAFIDGYNQKFGKNVIGVTDEVMGFFMKYPWPGNVRQLKNCIESAMNFTDDGQWISFSSLPPYLFEKSVPVATAPRPASVGFSSPVTVMEEIKAGEREGLIAALKAANGNMAAAARSLGISRQTMVYRVKKYGLK